MDEFRELFDERDLDMIFGEEPQLGEKGYLSDEDIAVRLDKLMDQLDTDSGG